MATCLCCKTTRTQRSMTWCSQAIPKGQSHQQMRKKQLLPRVIHRELLGSWGVFKLLFPCPFYWYFPWSLYLHSFSSERSLTGQVGSILPLMVPQRAFPVKTQASLTICQEELVSCCYIPHFSMSRFQTTLILWSNSHLQFWWEMYLLWVRGNQNASSYQP